jgi:DNA-binding transcriptional regulator PaaX
MPVPVRKQIIDYITANGPVTEAELVMGCAEEGIRESRVNAVLARLVTRGVLTESGGDYSIV